MWKGKRENIIVDVTNEQIIAEAGEMNLEQENRQIEHDDKESENEEAFSIRHYDTIEAFLVLIK